MPWDMANLGYDFPLHSFDLIAGAGREQDEQRFSIPVPQGRLVLRPELRARGRNLSTAAVEQAITQTLSHRQLDPAGFARHGHDDAWVESVLHWRQRMIAAEGERMQIEVEGRHAAAERQAAVREGIDLRARASLAARLARLGKELVVPGRRRNSAVGLQADLEGLLERLQVPGRAEALARGGFGPEEQARVAKVAAALPNLRRLGVGYAEELRQRSDLLSVLRGALVGDLCRLCLAAPRVLPPEAAQHLTQARIFPPRPARWRRPRGDATNSA